MRAAIKKKPPAGTNPSKGPFHSDTLHTSKTTERNQWPVDKSWGLRRSDLRGI